MMKLACWDQLLQILSHKAALKLLVSPCSISAKIIVQELVSLHIISPAQLELHIYPWEWVHTIPILQIQMLLKLVHREWHKIGIARITYPQINRLFVLPLRQVFCRDKWRCLSIPALLLLVNREKSAHEFDWILSWIQIFLSYELWIWAAFKKNLSHSLAICVN